MKSWDIFCSAIDNFGDVGVSWRLARQLAHEFALDVRLFVDDPKVLELLCPEVSPSLPIQWVSGVQVIRWGAALEVAPAAVVIETFGCRLPDTLISAMAARDPASLWINLEYLSAESWVEDCHCLPSPQVTGPQKYFYFPGFTERTGGLLREKDLLLKRQQFTQADKRHFLRKLGVDPSPGSVLVSVFTYENESIASWLEILCRDESRFHLLVPTGRISKNIQRWLGVEALAHGEIHSCGQLTIQAIPFVRQEDYDLLLWSCDLNLVRGEDSFVRAQWACKPFLWHIYPQEEDVHLEKLAAFLRYYLDGMGVEAAAATQRFWGDWNRQKPLQESWAVWQKHWPDLERNAERWCSQLARQPGLAESLARLAQSWYKRRAEITPPF
ncbi:MAG TPA: elongation factor P maturation arginine rhamnosyltransferase EarP [Gammaproteobacteria bacterium]|nr:elongation factor P maturation arginine rhamnosyltransferase EarP [Gammaproteobacteria bacterium]